MVLVYSFSFRECEALEPSLQCFGFHFQLLALGYERYWGEPGNEKECKFAFHAEEGACVFKYGPDSAQAPAAPRPKRIQPSTESSPTWRPASVDTQLEG
jgi:hypothetical protein